MATAALRGSAHMKGQVLIFIFPSENQITHELLETQLYGEVSCGFDGWHTTVSGPLNLIFLRKLEASVIRNIDRL